MDNKSFIDKIQQINISSSIYIFTVLLVSPDLRALGGVCNYMDYRAHRHVLFPLIYVSVSDIGDDVFIDLCQTHNILCIAWILRIF